MTHPDAETIAEYQAGALASWRVVRRRRVASHLAGCPECSAVAHRLAAVSSVLAAAPRPSMPLDVAERLTTVLAVQPSPDNAPSPHKRSRGLLAPPGGRRPRFVPAAAALAILAAVGAGGYALSQTTGSAPREASAGSAASVPKPSFGNVGVSPERVGASNGVNHAVYRVVDSGTDYLEATLRAQLGREMADGALAPATAPRTLPGCLTRLGAASGVTFVDLARYQGRKAWIIGSANRAWVTGTACSSSLSDLFASVTLAATS